MKRYRKYSKAERLELLRESEIIRRTPGETLTDWCRSKGFSTNCLAVWRRYYPTEYAAILAAVEVAIKAPAQPPAGTPSEFPVPPEFAALGVESNCDGEYPHDLYYSHPDYQWPDFPLGLAFDPPKHGRESESPVDLLVRLAFEAGQRDGQRRTEAKIRYVANLIFQPDGA
jgi:hypothetical protein